MQTQEKWERDFSRVSNRTGYRGWIRPNRKGDNEAKREDDEEFFFCIMYTEDMEDSSGGKKLADTTWVLEKPLPAPAVGERSSATKIGGETLTTEDVFERFMGTGVTSRREDKDGASLLRRDIGVYASRILAQEFPVV